MSKSLKEFLTEQAEQIRSEEEANKAEVTKWEAAIRRLIDQIEAWLKDSDPEGILDIRREAVDLAEDPIGRYQPLSLQIWMGGHHANVMPVALSVIGPSQKPGEGRWRGRVDVDGPSDSFSLYRFVHADGREDWLIRDEENYTLSPLDREKFESMFMRLFS